MQVLLPIASLIQSRSMNPDQSLPRETGVNEVHPLAPAPGPRFASNVFVCLVNHGDQIALRDAISNAARQPDIKDLREVRILQEQLGGTLAQREIGAATITEALNAPTRDEWAAFAGSQRPTDLGFYTALRNTFVLERGAKVHLQFVDADSDSPVFSTVRTSLEFQNRFQEAFSGFSLSFADSSEALLRGAKEAYAAMIDAMGRSAFAREDLVRTQLATLAATPSPFNIAVLGSGHETICTSTEPGSVNYRFERTLLPAAVRDRIAPDKRDPKYFSWSLELIASMRTGNSSQPPDSSLRDALLTQAFQAHLNETTLASETLPRSFGTLALISREFIRGLGDGEKEDLSRRAAESSFSSFGAISLREAMMLEWAKRETDLKFPPAASSPQDRLAAYFDLVASA